MKYTRYSVFLALLAPVAVGAQPPQTAAQPPQPAHTVVPPPPLPAPPTPGLTPAPTQSAPAPSTEPDAEAYEKNRKNLEVVAGTLASAAGSLKRGIAQGKKVTSKDTLTDDDIKKSVKSHNQALKNDLAERAQDKGVQAETQGKAALEYDSTKDHNEVAENAEKNVAQAKKAVQDAHEQVLKAAQAHMDPKTGRSEATQQALDDAKKNYTEATDTLTTAHDALLVAQHQVQLHNDAHSSGIVSTITGTKRKAQNSIKQAQRNAIGTRLEADKDGALGKSTEHLSKALSKKDGKSIFGNEKDKVYGDKEGRFKTSIKQHATAQTDEYMKVVRKDLDAYAMTITRGFFRWFGTSEVTAKARAAVSDVYDNNTDPAQRTKKLNEALNEVTTKARGAWDAVGKSAYDLHIAKNEFLKATNDKHASLEERKSKHDELERLEGEHNKHVQNLAEAHKEYEIRKKAVELHTSSIEKARRAAQEKAQRLKEAVDAAKEKAKEIIAK